MQNTINVLLIEDNPGDKRLIQHMLMTDAQGGGSSSYTLVWYDTLAAGLNWVADNPVDVVLLDLSLPDSQGLATAQRMQAAAPTLPIIVMTGMNDDLLAVQSVHAGIQDYLVKGAVDSALLRRAIRYALERKQMMETLRRMNTILEQKVAERTAQLEAAVAELKRAAQQKDEFLGAVSHEMRTPLTGILAMAEALELQVAGELNERQLRYVGTIHAGGKRLLEMVNSILRYTRIISSEFKMALEPCDVTALCQHLAHEFEPIALQKGQTFVYASVPESLEIVSNGDGVCQVLHNLLDNAVKFTPEHGKIRLDLTADSETVRLAVADTGIGIPTVDLDLVFQPFIQADSGLARHYGGIGLGLAYVRRVVEMLGGNIVVQSEPGCGSCFVVTLPRRQPA